MQARECTNPPCPWQHRYPRQRDYFVPSSTPFLARFGLEALATVRVEEDTGAVPRSDTGSVAFGRNGLSSSNGRFSTTARSHILPNFRDTRAQGKPGARCTRGLACKIVQKSAHEHTGSAEAVRPSLRNGFNGFLRALPGDRAFLSPSLAEDFFRQLDASVGASGPHDFAVRERHALVKSAGSRP